MSFRSLLSFGPILFCPLLVNVLSLDVAQAAPGQICLLKNGETVVVKRRCNAKRGQVRLNLGELVQNVAASGVAGPTGPKGDKGDTGNAGATGAPGQDAAWGDGSAGDLIVDGAFSGLPDNRQFKDIVVEAGNTLFVSSGTTLRCTGSLTVEGTIRVLESGFVSRAIDPSAQTLTAPEKAATIGIARRGATSGETKIGGGVFISGGFGGDGLRDISMAKSIVRPPIYAGGGGGGSASSGGSVSGGGSVAIYCKDFMDIAGQITAKGRGTAVLRGGGGGGIVILASANTISVTGVIDVSGGDASSPSNTTVVGPPGGGGGGIVNMLAPSFDTDNATFNISGGAGAPAKPNGTYATNFRVFGGNGGGASYGNGGRGGSINTTQGGSAGSPGGFGIAIEQTIPNPAGMLY